MKPHLENMKRNYLLPFTCALAVASALLTSVSPVRAGVYTWSTPVPITTADATLNIPGSTIVGAEAFGDTAYTVTLTNGTVINFKTDGSVASTPNLLTGIGAWAGTTGNANFDQVLGRYDWNVYNNPITIHNLTPGTQYAVQLFALDDRGGSTTRTVYFQDPNDASDVSATYTMGDNYVVTATFTATSTTASITQLGTWGANLNALVVYALPAASPPTVLTAPLSTTNYVGEISIFNALAANATQYQWQAGAVGSGVFTNLPNGGQFSGVTNFSLKIFNLQAGNQADYRCVASNSAGSTNTPPATLTVLAGPPTFIWSDATPVTTAEAALNLGGTIIGAEVFESYPETVSLASGIVVPFVTDGSVAAISQGGDTMGSASFSGNTGNANFNAVLRQSTFAGSTSTMVIDLYNLTVGQQYSVQLFALDDRGAYAGNSASFQDPNDPINVSIPFKMGDIAYVVGTFTASAPTMSVQENINTAGDINAVVVRALSQVIAPQIVTAPQSMTNYTGLTAAFSVGVTGTAPHFQWQAGPVGSGVFTNLVNGGQISGATNATLTLANLTVGVTDYQVVVSNGAGSVTSAPPATLTVLQGNPTIWSGPILFSTADAILGLPGTIVGAEVFGTTPYTVTLTNGTVIDFKNDGSVASLTDPWGIDGFGTGAYGQYSTTGNTNFDHVLTQFNWNGSPKTITLNNLTPGRLYSVQIFALDDRFPTAFTNTVTFTDAEGYASPAMAIGAANYVNSYLIGTFTASNTTASFLQTASVESVCNLNALVVRLVAPPQIVTAPQSLTNYTGHASTLTVVASSAALVSYQWQAGASGSGVFTNLTNGGSVSGATNATLTLANPAVGVADYRVVVANAAGSVTSAPPATLTVLQSIWSAPVAITTADATLGLPGTIVGAEAFGDTAYTVTLTGGTVINFTNDGSVASIPNVATGTGALIATTGNADFDAVLGQYDWNAYNNTVTVNNLTPGTMYSVQLFGLDGRYASRQVYFQDASHPADVSATFTMGDNDYVTATFTATGATASFTVLGVYGANLNALVVRNLTAQPPASPTLGISHDAGTGSITFNWPVASSGFTLYQSPVLGPGANWTPVSGTPATVGTNYQMTVLTTNSTEFFRLKY